VLPPGVLAADVLVPDVLVALFVLRRLQAHLEGWHNYLEGKAFTRHLQTWHLQGIYKAFTNKAFTRLAHLEGKAFTNLEDKRAASTFRRLAG
jgi:hypothetical protein